MKIKNDYVIIQSGSKKYELKNYILQEYLKRFASSQFSTSTGDPDNSLHNKTLKRLLIKFDSPIGSIDENTELTYADFDFFILKDTIIESEYYPNKIVTQYYYDIKQNDTYQKPNGNLSNDYSEYIGKKITALGFTCEDSYITQDNPVLAVLDTSNFDLTFQPDEIFSVTRKDTVTNEAEFWSDSKRITCPIHLSPNYYEELLQDNVLTDGTFTTIFKNRSFAVLTSVGYGIVPYKMLEEIQIGDTGADIFITNNEIEIKGSKIKNTDVGTNELHPNNELYPDENLYPIQINNKYVILKYKVYQAIHTGTPNNITKTITDTGLDYLQAVPLNVFGEFSIKIKYERG